MDEATIRPLLRQHVDIVCSEPGLILTAMKSFAKATGTLQQLDAAVARAFSILTGPVKMLRARDGRHNQGVFGP